MRRPEQHVTVPIAEERLVVSRRPVETGGIQVHIGVESHPEAFDLDLDREELLVRRVPVDREVDGAPPEQWWDGDELVLPVLEERLVVVRRLFVREEVRIRRRLTREHHHEEVRRRVETASVRRYRRPEPPRQPTSRGKKP